jgi:hypothetical protein
MWFRLIYIESWPVSKVKWGRKLKNDFYTVKKIIYLFMFLPKFINENVDQHSYKLRVDHSNVKFTRMRVVF